MMRQGSLFYLWLIALILGACGSTEDPTPQDSAPPAESSAKPSETVPQGPGTATTADGVEIAYTVRGEGETALVFIHGWSCDQSFWSQQTEAFVADYTVVTLDLAGHGASGTNRDPWRVSTFGNDVAAVVEALGLPRVILIGHSMGGPAALEGARQLADRVIGVIGVDTFHNAELKADPEQWGQLLAAYEADYTGTCDRFVRGMFPADADRALIGQISENMCDGPPEVGKALLKDFGVYELAATLGFVSAPVRAINATTYPTEVEINRKYAPEFAATLMEGVGHFLMMERPQEFNALLAETVRDLESRLVVM